MLRRRRSPTPFTISTDNLWPARGSQPGRWRRYVAEALMIVVGLTILVSGGLLFDALMPMGERFADFIDQLAGGHH